MWPLRRRKNTAETHLALQGAAEDWLRRPRDANPDAIVLQAGQGRVEMADDTPHNGMKKAQPSRAVAPLAGPKIELPDRLAPYLVTLLTPTAFETEPYRVLGHMVAQMHTDAGLRLLAIASPSPGDGKTITAINLVGVLAQEPQARVLLVEADLRRPSLLTYLGREKASMGGLVQAILDPMLSLESVVQQYPSFNFNVLPAGHSLAAPYDVLKLPRFGELLQETRQHYDYVVVDTPPLIPFADCRLIEKCVDGLLVVVAAHKTSRKLLEEALHVIDPTKLVGLVFNQDIYQTLRYHRPYYRYYPQSRNGQQRA